MSNHENCSSSPTDDLDGREDKFQQTYQDPRTSIDGFGSPALKTSRTGYQPYSSTTVNGGTQGTATSLSNQSSRQPINDAVTSAVNTTDSNLSPELIQLITQNVIQQLHVHKATAAPSAPPVQPPSNIPGDAPDTIPSFQESPILNRSSAYTPPSPHRPDDKFADNVTMPTMPTAGSVNASGYATRRRDVSPFSRASNEEAILSEAESRTSRPEAPRRSSTDHDGTVLEKYWGKLFDVEGQSTERLQHFLEGLALQLIENYEPKHSLVITPDKMQRFYEDTKLEERPEIYPWKLVFDDKTSSISRLLRERDIKVQHHLVQATPDARPDIPGLTPFGFASWMTLLIKAHPDHEYERLAKALRIMGVNHPQDRGQRFPAAISRRLFPATGDETVSARLTELMAAHCKVQISSRQSSTTVPPDTEVPQSPRKAEIPPAPTVEDALDESEKAETIRGQQPKDSGVSFTATESTTFKPRDMPLSDSEPSKATSVTSIEDESDVPTRQPPLERQRQPYVAQPGGGKTHDLTSSGDETFEQTQTQMPFTNDLRRTKSVSNPQRPRVPPPIAIHQRPEAQVPQPNGAELSRSRSSVVGGQTGASTHRSRSNSTHEREARPYRRQRSNSTYANDAGKRYYPQRNPSFSKGGPDFQSPRTTDPTLNYASYATNNRPASMYQPPTADRYEYTRPSTYDPRDPRYEREKSRDRNHDTRSRPRFQSSAGQDYPSPDDFRRSQQAYVNGNGVVQPAGGAHQQYPPTAFRDGFRLKSACTPVIINLDNDDSILAAAKIVKEKFGYLDVLVNNAGINSSPNKNATLRETYQVFFETNVFAVAVMNDTFLPLIRASKHPHRRIVTVTSGLGMFGVALTESSPYNIWKYPVVPAYRSSEAAVNMLSAFGTVMLRDGNIPTILVEPVYCRTAFGHYNGDKDADLGGKVIARAAVEGESKDLFLKIIDDEGKHAEFGW